jgi:hypothetical protein
LSDRAPGQLGGFRVEKASGARPLEFAGRGGREERLVADELLRRLRRRALKRELKKEGEGA